MLSFATEFPVKATTSTREFLEAVRRWILDSPHTTILSSDLASMVDCDEWSLPPGPESVGVLMARGEALDAAAVRYVRLQDNLEWTTIVVFRKLAGTAWTTLRVSCESTHPQTRLPAPKKPVLIRTLMQTLGTGKDGALIVQHTPHVLDDYDIELAAALMNGTAGCRLPVVYISAGFDGVSIINEGTLAKQLAGMAHVVVEPNRPFSQRLRISVDCNNVYGGSVGIYWPDAFGRRAFYLGPEIRSSEQLIEAVNSEVHSALVNRRPLEDCTWSAVQSLVSRQRIQQLKASGSNEVQSYIDTFEQELLAVREQKARADGEIERLSAELRRLQPRAGAGQNAIQTGEQDFYPGEVLDAIRDAIEDSRSRVPHDSRRQHILDAFVRANAKTGRASEYRETLKATLREYTSLDKRTRRALEDLGFSIQDEGKHYKLVFQGDDRYTFTLPKSGSDHRGGLNAASDIGKLLF